jgi:hypothetical protein
MRPRIYPEYYITTNDGIRTQVDKPHFFNELMKYFPNPKEVLSKLENEDAGISVGDKYFFVIKK